MSRLELVGDGHVKLIEELRASRPVASPALRARVAELGPVERREPWSPRLPRGRLVLGLAAAALLGSFVAAGVTGLGGTSSGEQQTAGGGAAASVEPQRSTTRDERGSALRGRVFKAVTPQSFSFDVVPNTARLQRYEATLRLRVKDVEALSSATRRAMSLTRDLGGYVGSVQYSTHAGKRGGAMLVLRVPIAKVQTALTELSTYGTIMQQHAEILDVTRRADRESKQIAKLQRELEVAPPGRAAEIRLKLKTLRAKRARLLRSAGLALISLGVTTPAQQAAASPSRFDRTLDDAGSVLLRELEILLYALVVVGPLLLLGGLATVAARAGRRRADERLLERA